MQDHRKQNVKSPKRRCRMKQFYEHIHVDAETLRFYAACPICGIKQYGARIPLLCRSVRTLARCVKGKANKISQTAFNHTKANTTQQLAIQFNQCRYCYRWVCDACFDISDDLGACRDCSEHRKKNTLHTEKKIE